MADRIAILDKGEVDAGGDAGRNLRGAGLALRRRLRRQREHVRGHGRRARRRQRAHHRAPAAPRSSSTTPAMRSTGNAVAFAIRPEKIKVSSKRPEGAANAMEGEVYDLAYLGDMTVYHVKLADGQVVKASALNSSRASRRPADLERPRLDLLPAGRRRRADAVGAAMSNAAMSVSAARRRQPSLPMRALQAVLSRLVIIVPYLWLLFFFLIPSSSSSRFRCRRRRSPCRPTRRCSASTTGIGGLLVAARAS